MTETFRPDPGGVRVEVTAAEKELLVEIPALLAGVGRTTESDPASARLAMSPYPDDPLSNGEFRRLMDSELREARAADRSAFELTADIADQGVVLSQSEAEAWLRVLGEARLVTAARLGLSQEDWDMQPVEEGSPLALLHYLSWLQGNLVEVLGEMFTP